ncbi:hypothetical protein SD960_08120 [Flavobacterium sp. MMLR14_040]|uniref:hypothetical protein n=1 Tax=Flavobacterium sp. MMLR14_040 TaxID=3093843 RepID=UPI002990695D|nr:hypothetical protein [Flavobacterium sp. MMLR14_040]MDW8850053.1 hypothetical protein [Flavobacterium sp. MMLR14_040]
MKKIMVLLLINYSIGGCAQKEIKKEDIINKENVKKVANIYKEVKKYDYKPSYTLHIEKVSNFTFEALVNDEQLIKNYNSKNFTGSMPINEALLHSGKQKLTIRMTPLKDDDFIMAKEIDMENIALKLSINYGDYGKEKVKDFKEALRYELPKQKGKLPYYEVHLEFDAPIVPYENDVEGWKNGVDLTKEDKDKLLKEVEDFYKEMIGYYDAKDVNAIAGKYYKRQLELDKVGYRNQPEDSQMLIDGWVKHVNDIKPFVFEDYAMRFYGNGKMVALVRTDKYYFNFSNLIREDAEGNFQTYAMYLYRPKAGAPLEVIR